MNKNKTLLMSALAISLLLNNLVYAATQTYSTSVENNISTGDIDISLDEYELDEDGNRIDYVNDKIVVPGQKVDKIVVITNNAEPSWIRVKVEYNTDDGLEDMSDDMLEGITDKWVKHGDYFYYTNIVNSDASVDFFEKVIVPKVWDETYSDKGFSIGITAQAVQSANFNPDFNSDDPWFGVPIEKCIHTNQDIYKTEGGNRFSVVFENGSEGFIKMGDDFFKNFSAMMPGDTITDSVEFGNNSNYSIKLYFSTEVPEQSEESIKLLNDLKLTIKNGNTEIYNGSLSAESLKDGIQLGDTFRKGDMGRLTYTISMPAELTNSSAMKSAKVKWIFRTEYNTTTGGGNSGGGGGGGSSITPAREPNPTPTSIEDNPTPHIEQQPETPTEIEDNKTPLDRIIDILLPKTGDTTNTYLWYRLALISVIGCIMIVVEKKFEKNKKKTK